MKRQTTTESCSIVPSVCSCGMCSCILCHSKSARVCVASSSSCAAPPLSLRGEDESDEQDVKRRRVSSVGVITNRTASEMVAAAAATAACKVVSSRSSSPAAADNASEPHVDLTLDANTQETIDEAELASIRLAKQLAEVRLCARVQHVEARARSLTCRCVASAPCVGSEFTRPHCCRR